MYDFLLELLDVLKANFELDMERKSIMGHSVGGHGAVMFGLRNAKLFRSISAFAPMLHPTAVPWGMNALPKFLGSLEEGKEYDSTVIAEGYEGPNIDVKIDQGE